MQDYLGVNVDIKSDGSIKLWQPQLIKQILTDLGLDNNSKRRRTPPLSSKILQRYENAPPFNEKFKYRSIIGKLNYLQNCTRGDIAYSAHQCARFSADPKKEHGEAVI